ncbi:hypothetical protein EJ05DRAFT_482739 [Pseudovirgaria hyperparasitica]|uniref:Uncharacterized protein n=1 Tax=Pseudovirgaria hyperparasitica TaxID=470096 RepID=A0A6A6WI63_9PEZI|nr:uncharacterized protein EJ05DRAFT_482739 [Pseudovirgaria hyperparasitica]KAF2761929.1 hypothetical protein EJ05DRAFT_482739 [Pseudovirgaria hyperparasitica]
MSSDDILPDSSTGDVIGETDDGYLIQPRAGHMTAIRGAEECDMEDSILTDDEDTKSILTEASHLLGHKETPEDLHLRFAKILGSAAVSSLGSQATVSVPKDFSMRYPDDNPHGSYAVQLATYQQLLKNRQLNRRREDSNASAAKGSRRRGKAVRPGFDPVQLIKKSALHFTKQAKSKLSTLQNPIHPIFRAENFHATSDVLYEQFKPALRLASLLLTDRACSQYFHTLWFGRRLFCEATSRAQQTESFRIKEDVPYTSENARIFHRVLAQHSDHVHFYFNNNPLSDRSAQASMTFIKDTKNLLPLHHSHSYETFTRGKICLHGDFYTVAKRNSALSHPDPAAVLRYHFWLALSLCHEVAHFLEWVRRSSMPSHKKEVYYYEDEFNEAGEAWEKKLFGGRIEPINSRADCAFGLATVDWPMVHIDNVEDTDANTFWALPMEFIAEIQQQKFWDLLAAKERPESDATIFHIPRIGTRSQHLSSVNMKVWDDEAAPDLISDDFDNVDTILKRTANGRIVKRPREKKRLGLMSKKLTKSRKDAKTRPSDNIPNPGPYKLRKPSQRGKVKLKEAAAVAARPPQKRADDMSE